MRWGPGAEPGGGLRLVESALLGQRYETLKRAARGLVRRYLETMTGLSRAQTTRLIGQYLRGEAVQPQPYRRRRFPQRYTRQDAALLAEVDMRRTRRSAGRPRRKLLERACYDFGGERSGGWLRFRSRTCTASGPAAHTGINVSVLTRAAVARARLWGYLRVDTVHQGDMDGAWASTTSTPSTK